MEIEFDIDKDEINFDKHGISLSRAADLDILAFLEDDRNKYGEVRYRAWGLIDDVPHCLAFTHRNGRLRAISLRRAHKKEYDRYVKQNSH
ncbi:BrnT family toxin [Rhizobium sp. Leaf262]|uniref:BrnT family toxin n=1 Tax=Rhizobium sp. Leaf262 TaxID=1736312 RepID=UPI0009EB22B1|nr:BrnT family toxin [Rhizobium sp. Leaf262]